MRRKLRKLLITGGAGFIGSAFVKLLIRDSSLRGQSLIIVDKLTYAGDLKRLKEVDGKFKFYKADICCKQNINRIFRNEKPDTVVHFAAESHVDRSINNASPFIDTNIKGTQVLIDASRKYGARKFIFISTDEVYGEISKGKFNEDSPIKPNSPYAASKAAADILTQAYIRTYNFPGIIVRPSNNYGPWQYPEKLIPLSILKILKGGKIPVYGKGKNVREWLYVDDCAKGIMSVMKKGKIGMIYNLGSAQERANIDTVKLLLKTLRVSQDRIEFVKDRLGHDLRYRLNSDRVKKETGWKPEVNFEEGLKKTAEWCLLNKEWLFGKWKNIAPLYKNR